MSEAISEKEARFERLWAERHQRESTELRHSSSDSTCDSTSFRNTTSDARNSSPVQIRAIIITVLQASTCF